MIRIKEEAYLNCSLKEVYEKFADINFLSSIDKNKKLDVENKVLYQNDRLITYELIVNNVGSWQSTRILVPETNLIITKREKPLSPFKYMVILHLFQQQDNGVNFIYLEEFEMDDDHISEENDVTNSIKKKLRVNMENIIKYFNEGEKNE